MSVDVEALKILALEKKLPLERLINAIENEQIKAYFLKEFQPKSNILIYIGFFIIGINFAYTYLR